MRGPAEFPQEDVAEYWQLVRAALVAGGMSKKEAAEVAEVYREYMKPAGWAFYNRDPDDAAEYAVRYAAWMRKKQTAKRVPTRRPVKLRQSSLSSIAASNDGAEWVRAKNMLNTELGRPPTSVEVGKFLGISKAVVEQALPIEGDIQRLPRWARVGFAARCVRRVLPLFSSSQPPPTSEQATAVTLAVEEAESAASSAVSAPYSRGAADAARTAYLTEHLVPTQAYIADAADMALRSATNAQSSAVEAVARVANRAAEGHGLSTLMRRDFEHALESSTRLGWGRATPVPPAVFGPLWPEGPPKDWPELPKPTLLKLTVQVPDGMDDAAVCDKLKALTAALGRLNIAGGGHGLKFVPPVEFTEDQVRGLADVVREEEGQKSQGGRHPGR